MWKCEVKSYQHPQAMQKVCMWGNHRYSIQHTVEFNTIFRGDKPPMTVTMSFRKGEEKK